MESRREEVRLTCMVRSRKRKGADSPPCGRTEDDFERWNWRERSSSVLPTRAKAAIRLRNSLDSMNCQAEGTTRAAAAGGNKQRDSTPKQGLQRPSRTWHLTFR